FGPTIRAYPIRRRTMLSVRSAIRRSRFEVESPRNRAGRKTRRSMETMSMFTRRKAIGLFRLVALAAPFKIWPIAAQTQATTDMPGDSLLSGSHRTYVRRPRASVPLQGADSTLPNVNWVRGNEARAEWTWAAQLFPNPNAVQNNLGRYLVQIPGVLEKQLDYS